MTLHSPANLEEVRSIIEQRLAALDNIKGAQETVSVEWRGAQRAIPVISMPVDLLYYNPGTHRIRAQRATDPSRERDLDSSPYGVSAQAYLQELLKGDPAEPSKVDPSFNALKDDLKVFGQNDPGIITRSGVLINGNTRRAALKELGQSNIRVGVLPPDAGHTDLQSIELSLQLRKDHRRDYSFMNFLLAIDERAAAGELPAKIQTEFRIKASTYERSQWILEFIRDAIERSQVVHVDKTALSLRLIDFETHQGKLEELYRSYYTLASKAPDDANALREQRLLALVLDKSKTDLRLIDADFVKRFMPTQLPTVDAAPPDKIPGTSIEVPGASKEIQALRELTTRALKARSISRAPQSSNAAETAKAAAFLGQLDAAIIKALDSAGKQVRLVRRRFQAADRISDACDDLALAVEAVAEARSTNNFEPEDLDEILVTLKTNLAKLATIVLRGTTSDAEGIAWLRAVANPTVHDG
jgi:hypothetical protein